MEKVVRTLSDNPSLLTLYLGIGHSQKFRKTQERGHGVFGDFLESGFHWVQGLNLGNLFTLSRSLMLE